MSLLISFCSSSRGNCEFVLIIAAVPGKYLAGKSVKMWKHGGHEPGKPGILRDFSEHGKLTEFSANSVQP